MARHVDALERYRPRTVSRFGTVKTRRPGLPVMSAPVTPPKPAPSSSSASRPISSSSKKSSVGSPQHDLRDDRRSLTQRQSPGVAVAGFRQLAPIHYTGKERHIAVVDPARQRILGRSVGEDFFAELPETS